MAKKTKKINAEKHFLEKIMPIAGRVAFVLAIMFLVVYLITVLNGSSEFFTDSAERNALLEFDKEMDMASTLADAHYKVLGSIAEKLQYADSPEAVKAVMTSYMYSPLYGDLRYSSQQKLYYADGTLLNSDAKEYQRITQLAALNLQGCTDVYRDEVMELDCVAFFLPVRGSAYIDGVISIVPASDVVSTKYVISDKTAVSMVIHKSGKVISNAESEGFTENVGNDFYEFISRLTYDKDEHNLVRYAVESGKETSCSINAIGSEYVIAMAPIPETDNNLILIAMSVSEGLIVPELVYIRQIINLVVIAILSIIIGLIYAIFYYRATQKTIAAVSFTDLKIGCPNAEQFKISAENAISQKQRRYVLAVFDIRRFHYIKESLSDEELTESIKFAAKVFETFCDSRETYGYLGDGRFALLMNYKSDKSIMDKIRLVETVVSKNNIFGGKGKKIFDIGVCPAFDQRRTSSVSDILSHAVASCERAKSDINKAFVMYTEQVDIERERDEKIEAEMESALANGDFRLFLQPKYNVVNDKVDSAEALVRWFDVETGEYIFPAEFISLFESNGFITKLDHYMYIETLKCISTAAEKREKVVPISVNVSLVTASAPDFLDFYISNKKKYNIPDNFITVEFTESFAMGDYGKIREIVTRLHANGIRCSLDDFGTGYASFNVLKNIPIDELKLDRLFLSVGYNNKNDSTLLATIIGLAKSLGISVVQEGVETKEMFDSVVEKGCDVIQGYYYARAIPVEEYKLFIGSNTSIKYKSLVK